MVLALPPSNPDAQRTLVISMKATKLLQFPSPSLFFSLATPCGMWDLNSLTRDPTQCRTRSAVKVQNPNHWITREVPFSAFFDLHFVSSLLNFYFEIIPDVQIH
jgi:hypothetical protein